VLAVAALRDVGLRHAREVHRRFGLATCHVRAPYYY
jgi:hypothetical protein